jgi:hypothetical protein
MSYRFTTDIEVEMAMGWYYKFNAKQEMLEIWGPGEFYTTEEIPENDLADTESIIDFMKHHFDSTYGKYSWGVAYNEPNTLDDTGVELSHDSDYDDGQ